MGCIRIVFEAIYHRRIRVPSRGHSQSPLMLDVGGCRTGAHLGESLTDDGAAKN